MTPTRAGETAETLLAQCEQNATDIFHITCSSYVTPYEFGEMIDDHVSNSEELLSDGAMDDVDRNTAASMSKRWNQGWPLPVDVARGCRSGLGPAGLDLVAVPGFEEVFPCLLGKVFEAKDFLTVESRTLHLTIVFEFVRSDDGTTGRAGVSNNSHR